MSDHETSTLTARLTSLADELTPSADPVGQVRAARARYRRQRRNRVVASGLVAVAAALAVGVPTAIASFSTASGHGEVAGPSETPGTGTPGSETPANGLPLDKGPGLPPTGDDVGKTSRWTDMLDERAERDARLSPLAESFRESMAGRPAPLALTAPERFGQCPDWAPALSTSLGVSLQRAPIGSGGPFCVWSGYPDNEDLLVQLEYATGTTREQMVREVDSEVARLDCYPTALPGTAVFSALALCEEDARTTWRLRFPDTSESVVWTLTVSVSDRYPGDDVQAVMTAVEQLDATW